MAVLLAHAVLIYSSDFPPAVGLAAAASVMAFFVLSGFFIHQSLAASVERGRPREYVAARVNRIVPPFLFSILLVIGLWALAPFVFASGEHSFAEPTARKAFSLTGLYPTLSFLNEFTGPTLSANGPLWSLSFEVWYYLLALLAAFAAAKRPAGWIFLPLLLILGWLNPDFLILGSVWALGFALSVLHSNGRRIQLSQWPFMIAALTIGWSYVQSPSDERLLLFDVSFGLWFAVHLAARLDRAPRIPLLPQAAGFSYTLYVTHFPLLLFTYGAGISPFAAVPMAFALAWIAGPRLERLQVIRREAAAGTGLGSAPACWPPRSSGHCP